MANDGWEDVPEGEQGWENVDATTKDSTLPNLEATEAKRAGRSDLLSQFDIKKEASLNPMTRIGNELALVGGVGQRAEAAIANPAVEMQKGNRSESVV